MSGLLSNSLFLSTAAAAGGLQIERSLRFNSSDSGFLSRVPGTAGNRTIYTWSIWLKRSGLGEYHLFRATLDGSNYTEVYFGSNDKLNFQNVVSASANTRFVTTQVFRDTSAWYHLVFSINGSTAAKLYVNGVEVTAFDTTVGPGSSNHQINNTVSHTIGSSASSSYANFYLTNIHLIDGQALTPSSFTETDATTGQLIPKTYTGSYGTNGFNLLFADNSSNTASTLGKDTSGLGNNFTPNNLSTSTGGPTSVAAASGALPLFNTTDTYGAVKGTGTRTDTYSSYISLALPMDGTNGGTSFGDQSAVIRGSGSAKTVTVTNPTTSTSQSKFYGSSGFFNNNGFLSIPYSSDVDLSGSGTDFTIETWIYRTTSDEDQIFEFRGNAGSTGLTLYVLSNNTIQVYDSSAGAQTASSGTISLNVWVHIAVTKSGSNCTYWINGISAGTFTRASFAATDATGVRFGASKDPVPNAAYLSGYLQDLRIYKGVAKYTGSFNPPSATANATIAAGNDSLVDSPVNGSQTDTGVGGEVRGNYCTLNPLTLGGSTQSSTLSNGNLDFVSNAGGGNYANRYSTFGVSSGKWYAEFTLTASTNSTFVGITSSPETKSSYIAEDSDGYAYFLSGTKWTSGASSAYGASWTVNDVIGIALDLTAGTLAFYKNGASQGTAFSSLASGTYFIGISGTTNEAGTFNFGQRAFAYTAPSGFKALNTQNLPASLVTKSNTVFDVVTYTGTGAARSITGLAFNPDLVWIKCRDAAYYHILTDSVRGTNKQLFSNDTLSEESRTDRLTSFDSTGFSLGSYGDVNNSGNPFVGWAWDAGTSTDPNNTAGSITSQVRANATAGFSVVTYTGTGANATVGHGLGVAPGFIIIKNRNAATNWRVYHSALGNTKAIFLSTTGASDTSSVYWNNTSPTSTVFSVGSDDGANGNTNLMVAYCFTPVVGYSSFGSYTGNGSSDGTFVYTGFRPRWVLIKQSSGSGENWRLFDTARNTYNPTDNRLIPNSSAVEGIGVPNELDTLSNGFKMRATDGASNGSGATYIYAAFAEAPLNYSRAR